MSPKTRNIIAIILGVVLGGAVNMAIIMMSTAIFPLPEDFNSSNYHLVGPKYFLFPFLAHALGTLVGAFVAAKVAANRKMLFAIIIGAFYLLGGIVMSLYISSPKWFLVLDLVVAYIPMAFIGGRYALRKRKA